MVTQKADFSANQLDKGFTSEQLSNFNKWYKQLSKKIEVSDVIGSPRLGPPAPEDTQRFPPVALPPAPKVFRKDLDKLVKLALDLGAAEAIAIPAKDIPQDIRAMHINCTYPRCRWLNTNLFCPFKTTFSLEHMKQFVSEYRYAIAYKVLPPEIKGTPDVGKLHLNMHYTMGGGPPPDNGMLTRNVIRLRILAEMARRLQTVAYYSGYVLNAPISAGPCLVTKCADKGRCIAMTPGELCRFVDVEPTGYVVYIDYHGLGRKLGWGELQVGGNCAFPEDVPERDGYYNIGMHLID